MVWVTLYYNSWEVRNREKPLQRSKLVKEHKHAGYEYLHPVERVHPEEKERK